MLTLSKSIARIALMAGAIALVGFGATSALAQTAQPAVPARPAMAAAPAPAAKANEAVKAKMPNCDTHKIGGKERGDCDSAMKAAHSKVEKVDPKTKTN